MDLKTTQEDHCYIIEVRGELDASSSIVFDQAMEKAISDGHRNILVDFTALDYISSAGLGVFMSYLRELEERSIKLVVFGVKEKVMSVFQILGLDEMIKMVDTKAEAKSLTNEPAV